MNRLQFRLLYDQFLLRIVDLEWLSPGGDSNKLLGQFGALLISLSVGFAIVAMAFGDPKVPREIQLVRAWAAEHSIIATTMLVVGLFAVLSWDSTFPDRRDVFVLSPLPVPVRTFFLAKVSASSSALAIAVLAFNALPGLVWPIALAPPGTSLLGFLFDPALYRGYAAYWITVFTAGAFLYASIVSVQCTLSQLLSRWLFLSVSSWLQVAAFGLFLTTYFLQPSIATPRGLSAPGNQNLLAWLPSYWFLGLYQELNGSSQPETVPLFHRACIGLAISFTVLALGSAISYLRVIRQIVEQPDIVPGFSGRRWLPRFGNSLETAVVQFSIRTLARSRQHRVTLAFYLGIGLSAVILLLKAGVARSARVGAAADAGIIFTSYVAVTAMIVGTRAVFSVPFFPNANWIFRLACSRSPAAYFICARRPLIAMASFPAWVCAAVVFLSIWPLSRAGGHLLVLGLWISFVTYGCLFAFRSIPFTRSYLPGKSSVHLAILGAWGLILLFAKGAAFEIEALEDRTMFVTWVAALAVLAFLARWRTLHEANAEDAAIQFEDTQSPAVFALDLHRDGTPPD